MYIYKKKSNLAPPRTRNFAHSEINVTLLKEADERRIHSPVGKIDSLCARDAYLGPFTYVHTAPYFVYSKCHSSRNEDIGVSELTELIHLPNRRS